MESELLKSGKIIKNPLTKSAERNILWNVDVSTPHQRVLIIERKEGDRN